MEYAAITRLKYGHDLQASSVRARGGGGNFNSYGVNLLRRGCVIKANMDTKVTYHAISEAKYVARQCECGRACEFV